MEKTAFNTILDICETELIDFDLRYCLVAKDKKPYKLDKTLASPNKTNDFVDIEEILNHSEILKEFAGIGISIQASHICAIDIDHCFEIPFEFSSINKMAKEIFDLFKEIAYCEFSFSGTGMRILFYAKLIRNYSEKYYIKNEKNKIEYYQPENSFRYVTLTGKKIAGNLQDVLIDDNILINFLKTYMIRPERKEIESFAPEKETRSPNKLMLLTKRLIFKNSNFQELWFNKAPGSGKNESELDFQFISMIYEYITRDYKMIKMIFESSPYFKSKDYKHKSKWEYQDNRYFKYIYSKII